MIERFRFDAAAAPARDERFKDLDRDIFAEDVAHREPGDRRDLSVAVYNAGRNETQRFLRKSIARERYHEAHPDAGTNQNYRNAPLVPQISPADRAAKARLLAIARNVEDAWIRKYGRESAKGAGA